ncbi:MAG: hypothetical protein QXJ24_02775 [Thermoplasmatales archaeon]
MVLLLDEEYIIQLDDTPPFSWIKDTPDRFMYCRKIQHKKVHIYTNSPLYSIALMAEDLLGSERASVFHGYEIKDGEHLDIILSDDGISTDAISAIRSQNKKGIVFSAGGSIKKEARENGWEYQSLPKGYPMKFMMPEVLGCILSMFGEAIDIRGLGEFINMQLPSSISQYNISKRLAYELLDKAIIIIYDGNTKGLANRYVDLLKRNANVNAVARPVEYSTNLPPSSEAKFINLTSNGEVPSPISVEGFPFNNNNIEGYLKNELVGEFTSVYMSILLGVEIDLLELK